MQRLLVSTGIVLLGLIGWPSPRIQAASLRAIQWGLQLTLASAVALGIGLSLAPDRMQELAPATSAATESAVAIWNALPHGTQWLLVSAVLMAVGLPVLSVLEFARTVTRLRIAENSLQGRESLSLAMAPLRRTTYDVETALAAIQHAHSSTASQRPGSSRTLEQSLEQRIP